MTIALRIGLNAIESYKRLDYTPWHALAEFIDNSTQSYANNKTQLDEALDAAGELLEVSIAYDPESAEHPDGFLRISDNAMGMDLDDLDLALHVAVPPANTDGRSKYGLGMKTAACWIGNRWSIRTKKLGSTIEHIVDIDVDAVSGSNGELPYRKVERLDPKDHYTIIEVGQHNRRFRGRTLGKIRQFLSSMYRIDLRSGRMLLKWQGEELSWDDLDPQLLRAVDGSLYKQEFDFQIDGKDVRGWAGVLASGFTGRSAAGFSVFHANRVVRGYPDAWRPEKIFGYEGRNDLINQRLVGEIFLDAFDVTHTKDGILWLGDQEERVERELRKRLLPTIRVARTTWKELADERGPTQKDVDVAVDHFRQELQSEELVDQLEVEIIPAESVVKDALKTIAEPVTNREPTIRGNIGSLRLELYVAFDLSPNDPYVVVESTDPRRVLVIVNMQHPHLKQIDGNTGVLNYFRDCTYDAIAEWQARNKAARIDPETIKLLKDKLLRIPLLIEEHGGPAQEADDEELPDLDAEDEDSSGAA